MQITIILSELYHTIYVAHISGECNAMQSKAISMSMTDECTEGPGNERSLRETLVENFIEMSNMAQILVLVLNSFSTVYISR